MQSRIFGHDVLQLLVRGGGVMAVEDFRALSEATFGAGTRIWNCHDESFTFDELLTFLEAKGKLVIEGGTARLGATPACGGH